MSTDKEKLHILPLYLNDFTSDELVEAMTTEEIGAYILLLFKAWKSSPPATIPNDDETLARYSRLTPDRWQACKARVLAPWQPIDGGRLLQKRLLKVHGEVVEKVLRRRKAGSQGGKATAAKIKGADDQVEDKGKGSNAASKTAAMPQQCCIDAGSKVPSIETANEQQSKTKPKSESNDTSHEVSSPPSPPGGQLEVGQILIEGEVLDFDEDSLRWQAEFIRRWNELPGVRRHDSSALSSFNLQLLRERLTESDWYWQRAFEKFPLHLPSRIWDLTLGTFLEPSTVSKILDGKYERPTHQTGVFASRQADEPWRIRTGTSSETLRQAMAEVLAERS